MRFKMMTAVAALSLLAVPAFAQDTTTTDAAPKPKKEKKICRREGQTGSILGGPSVCHTKDEWAKIDAARAKSAEDALNARPRPGSTSGL